MKGHTQSRFLPNLSDIDITPLLFANEYARRYTKCAAYDAYYK